MQVKCNNISMQEAFEQKRAAELKNFASELLFYAPLKAGDRKMRLRSPVLRRSAVVSRIHVRQALTLAIFSMFACLAEASAGMYFGAGEHSITLFGFGLDAVAEVGSSAMILWRFRMLLREGAHESSADRIKRERRATYVIGTLLILFGVSIGRDSISDLIAHVAPSNGRAGLFIASMSLLVMTHLWLAKKKLASHLHSAALLKDAGCSWVCMRLSILVLLSSLVLAIKPRLGWVDGAAGLLLAALVVNEGRRAVRAAGRPGFQGGCGCMHG
jgi:divalent metal cation (Fe/Co/Zn/Cd) transporter